MTSKVYPGSKVGLSKEIASCKHTYSEEGNVYCDCVAELEKTKDGAIKIHPFKRVLNLLPGTIVYGMVQNVTDKSALVSIVPAEQEEDVRYCNPDIWAMLHVSKLGHGYVKSTKDVLMTGDIIRVEIIKYDIIKNAIDVTMQGSGLGILIGRGGRNIKPKKPSSSGTTHRSRDYKSHHGSHTASRRSGPRAPRTKTTPRTTAPRTNGTKYKKSYETNRRKRVYGRRSKVVDNIKRLLKKKD